MKKMFLLLFLASTTIFFSCGKDNDNDNNNSNGGGGSYNAPLRHLNKAIYSDGGIDSNGDTVTTEYRFSWDGDHMTKIDVYHKSSFERLDLTFNIEWDGDKVIKTTMNRPNSAPGNITTFTYNGDQLVKSHSTYYDRDNGEKESEVLYEYANGKISQITYPDEFFPYPIEVTWDGNNIATLSVLDRTMLEYTYDSKKNPLYLPMGVINYYIIEGTFWEGVNNTIGYLLSLSSMVSGNPLSIMSSWSENNIARITDYDGSEIPIEYIYDGDYPISISRTFVYEDKGKGTETHTIEFYYDD